MTLISWHIIPCFWMSLANPGKASARNHSSHIAKSAIRGQNVWHPRRRYECVLFRAPCEDSGHFHDEAVNFAFHFVPKLPSLCIDFFLAAPTLRQSNHVRKTEKGISF
jgi:hypothetical protein